MSDAAASSTPPSTGAPRASSARVGTPRLDALLTRLRGALVRNVWLHGLGTVVAAAAMWLVFMYVADRTLKLPAPIRLLHAAVLVGGTIYLVRRSFLRHMRSVPDLPGLAMLAERALPEGVEREDLFVSAVQLPAAVAADAPASVLVAAVAARADELASGVDLRRVTDTRGPRGRLAVALTSVAVASIAFAAEPAMAKIFASRMLGANVAWPRATTLITEVPDDAPGLDVSRPEPGVLLVRAARGSDVPLLVRAIGVVPELVTAKFESGAAIDIGPSGPDTFRTILPSIQEPTTVRVVGGDDDRGVPEIRIEVLQPPDITGLAFVIEPPDYTGLPRRVETETKVSVLAGSRVTVHVETDPADTTGAARTFPDDQIVQLTPAPFPTADPVDPAAPVRTGLSFSEVVDQSIRFRIELRDSAGLENPDPALFGVEVIPDRRPELLILAPGRAETEVVESGVLPLRVLVRDDFGIADLRLEGRDAATDEVLQARSLALRDAPEALVGAEGRARVARLASEVLEVKGLFPDAETPVGRMTALFTSALDSRAPEPNETRSSAMIVRVVSSDEFLRSQRDGLSAAAEEVERLDRRLEQSGRELGIFVAAMSGDDAEIPEAASLVSSSNDARRLQGDLRSVARDLSALAEDMTFSRLDVRSGALERRLIELTSDSAERSFQEDSWRTIAQELAQGGLGSPERAGDLVRIVGLALEACGQRSDAWISSLEAVRAASGIEETRGALATSEQRLRELRETMDQLTGELGEWDSLQSILSLTRDILSRQKNLKERTRKDAENGR